MYILSIVFFCTTQLTFTVSPTFLLLNSVICGRLFSFLFVSICYLIGKSTLYSSEIVKSVYHSECYLCVCFDFDPTLQPVNRKNEDFKLKKLGFFVTNIKPQMLCISSICAICSWLHGFSFLSFFFSKFHVINRFYVCSMYKCWAVSYFIFILFYTFLLLVVLLRIVSYRVDILLLDLGNYILNCIWILLYHNNYGIKMLSERAIEVKKKSRKRHSMYNRNRKNKSS